MIERSLDIHRANPSAAMVGALSNHAAKGAACQGCEMHSLGNLREIARVCQMGEPLPASLAFWLSKSLETFLGQDCDSLNEAFGLRNKKGGVSWRWAANIQARDEALYNLAARHFAHLSASSQAAEIHKAALRYATSRWRFDRETETMNSDYRGTPKEFLWLAFKSGATMPLCQRRLRTILAEKRSQARL